MNQAGEIEAGVGQAQFERDGFLVLEGFFAQHRISRSASAVRSLLQEKPREIVVDSLRTGRRTLWAQADRQEARSFKFHDLYLLSEELRELALEPELASILEGLLGEPAVLCKSLNCARGPPGPSMSTPTTWRRARRAR